MQKIAFEQIRKTYNGRSGCACGCNGKYTLPSHVSIEEGNKEVGWNAYDEKSVSDRRAKIALKKVNQAIEDYGHLAKPNGRGSYEYFRNDREGRVWFCYSDSFAAIDLDDRATTVYFSK